jgi:hypothetical protein
MIVTNELKHLETTMIRVIGTPYRYDDQLYNIMEMYKNRTDDIHFSIVLLCCVRYYLWCRNHCKSDWAYYFYNFIRINHPNHFTFIDDIHGIKIVTWLKIGKGMFVHMYYEDKIYKILSLTSNNYRKPELWIPSTYYNLLTLF